MLCLCGKSKNAINMLDCIFICIMEIECAHFAHEYSKYRCYLNVNVAECKSIKQVFDNHNFNIMFKELNLYAQNLCYAN